MTDKKDLKRDLGIAEAKTDKVTWMETTFQGLDKEVEMSADLSTGSVDIIGTYEHALDTFLYAFDFEEQRRIILFVMMNLSRNAQPIGPEIAELFKSYKLTPWGEE